ncbi:aldo/keto reductase [Granulicoccus sp. GXG6511]|uniref:aldo/keto reductase n=1 Tax=Granulicoccus sp. GXG6511 TaxID=3381351 RepID=UPI003D7EAB4B
MHPTRRIPALDTAVSALGFGCMGISWAYVSAEERDDDAGVAIIREALDSGVTFLDTADAYAGGHNEQVVGRALAESGAAPVVATKAGLVGNVVDGEIVMSRNGRPDHIRAACDASLQRLGLEVIDLYYLHRVDPDVPLEESWGAYAELAHAGKIRAAGLSEVSVEQASAAQAIHPVAAIQSEFSLWARDALGGGRTHDGADAGDLITWTKEHQSIFVPFSPLGRGFLTGRVSVGDLKAGDFRTQLGRWQSDAVQANQAIVEGVRRVADRHGVTPAAIALAWVLAQGDHVIPIPGTTKSANLQANLAALTVSLTTEDLAELEGLPPAVGGRY